MADTSASQDLYLAGAGAKEGLQIAFLHGGGSGLDDVSSYLSGNILSIDSAPVYLDGESSSLDSVYSFVQGIVRGNVLAFLEGSNTGDDDVANDYIILRSSDSSIDEKFRVLAQDYDDGTPLKAQSTKRTLGGGLSHSVGGIYYSWTPIIKVRHTESVSGYGNLQDLTDLFELNNPNGTPSNIITFIDHHNVSRNVIMPGDFRKSTLGSAIEGTEAWHIVRLVLQELNNA